MRISRFFFSIFVTEYTSWILIWDGSNEHFIRGAMNADLVFAQIRKWNMSLLIKWRPWCWRAWFQVLTVWPWSGYATTLGCKIGLIVPKWGLKNRKWNNSCWALGKLAGTENLMDISPDCCFRVVTPNIVFAETHKTEHVHRCHTPCGFTSVEASTNGLPHSWQILYWKANKQREIIQRWLWLF